MSLLLPISEKIESTQSKSIHTKLQTIKYILDVYQNKFASEQAHDHLQKQGGHNPVTENYVTKCDKYLEALKNPSRTNLIS